jgi:hypothetical protein
MRVLYGAVLVALTCHRPFAARGVVLLYAEAVPDTKYSFSSYPTEARSNVVVPGRSMPVPPVTGPVTVACGTFAGTGTRPADGAVDASIGPADDHVRAAIDRASVDAK